MSTSEPKETVRSVATGGPSGSRTRTGGRGPRGSSRSPVLSQEGNYHGRVLEKLARVRRLLEGDPGGLLSRTSRGRLERAVSTFLREVASSRRTGGQESFADFTSRSASQGAKDQFGRDAAGMARVRERHELAERQRVKKAHS